MNQQRIKAIHKVNSHILNQPYSHIYEFSHIDSKVGAQMYNGQYYCNQHQRYEQILNQNRGYVKKDGCRIYGSNVDWINDHSSLHCKQIYQLLLPNDHKAYDLQQSHKRKRSLNRNYTPRKTKKVNGKWITMIQYNPTHHKFTTSFNCNHSVKQLINQQIIDEQELPKTNETHDKICIKSKKSSCCLMCMREKNQESKYRSRVKCTTNGVMNKRKNKMRWFHLIRYTSCELDYNKCDDYEFKCWHCKKTFDYDLLEFDHINNDGYLYPVKHMEIFDDPQYAYDNYQVLCRNCHVLKTKIHQASLKQ
jgi:hypothetical protein